MKVVLGIACTLTSCDDFRHIINDPAYQACKQALELKQQALQWYEHSFSDVAQRNDELERMLRDGVVEKWWVLFEEHGDEDDWMGRLMDSLPEGIRDEVWEVGRRKGKESEGGGEGEVEQGRGVGAMG